MSNNKTGKVITIIVYVLIALIILGAIGFVFKFTGGFTGEFKTFYVKYAGKDILTDTELGLPIEKELRFDVKYTFDSIDQSTEPKGYKLSIKPNVTDKTDFNFAVDGVAHLFKDEQELIQCFDITQYDEYFTLTLHSDTTVQSVLEQMYEGKTVEVPETLNMRDACYFALVITSYDDNSRIEIPFRISSADVMLYPDNIIF